MRYRRQMLLVYYLDYSKQEAEHCVLYNMLLNK